MKEKESEREKRRVHSGKHSGCMDGRHFYWLETIITIPATTGARRDHKGEEKRSKK